MTLPLFDEERDAQLEHFDTGLETLFEYNIPELSRKCCSEKNLWC